MRRNKVSLVGAQLMATMVVTVTIITVASVKPLVGKMVPFPQSPTQTQTGRVQDVFISFGTDLLWLPAKPDWSLGVKSKFFTDSRGKV